MEGGDYRKEKWCIVHFFMPDFRRCQIMDQKLDVSKTFGGGEDGCLLMDVSVCRT
jgi:hypothetical protein